MTTTNYPLASFVLLWLLAGWLPVTAARRLFTGVVIVSLTWLTIIMVRESLVTTRMEKVLVALFIVSSYPTAVVIGNGQNAIYIVAAFLSAVLLLARFPSSWSRDLPAAVLMIFSLVKPTISVPFCWLVLFTEVSHMRLMSLAYGTVNEIKHVEEVFGILAVGK